MLYTRFLLHLLVYYKNNKSEILLFIGIRLDIYLYNHNYSIAISLINNTAIAY